MFKSMLHHKLYWMLFYFPTHDHMFDTEDGGYYKEYWIVGGSFSAMDSAIRLT